MAARMFSFYVETCRRPYGPNSRTEIQAHQIPRTGFDFDVLSPDMTGLFYVHRAHNRVEAIALVVETFAGRTDTMVTMVTKEEIPRKNPTTK